MRQASTGSVASAGRMTTRVGTARRPAGARGAAGGGPEGGNPRAPARGGGAGGRARGRGGEFGVSPPVRVVLLGPFGFQPGAALPGEPPVRERFVGHVKRLEAGPAKA